MRCCKKGVVHAGQMGPMALFPRKMEVIEIEGKEERGNAINPRAGYVTT